MNVEKCRYHNDHQSACCLMIDDLVPVAVSRDGKIGPGNDWGYLKDGKDSQYQFLEENLFSKYPQIKGTIFLPLASHLHMQGNNEYQVLKTDFDNDFVRFLKNISSRFEFAFHGIKHTWKDEETGKTVFEFADPKQDDIKTAIKEVQEFKQKTGIVFYGGKFPGYFYNELAKDVIAGLGAKWWALSAGMIQINTAANALYQNPENKITLIPTNICGDAFNAPKAQNPFKVFAKRLFKNKYYQRPEEFLLYLYENGYPITIQEHYQNLGTSGKRQKPNIYDDINSLDKLFALLLSLDIWYANCTEIACAYDVFCNTKIIQSNAESFTLVYQGNATEPMHRIKADAKQLHWQEQDVVLQGAAKNGMWIYNEIKPGTYIRK